MTRWYQEKKREGFYKQAKREGFRARSAYKLKQINERFHVIRPGDAVVDLGCAPGGWTQVLVGLVGPKGSVVGVDLAPTAPIEGATLLIGDMTREETKTRVRHAMDDAAGADVVLSDMSPNISGNYDRDQAESVWLAGHAATFARDVLKRRGHLVVKVFEGQDFQEFLEGLRRDYARVKTYHPPASRKRSSEIYVIATDFKGTSTV